MNRVAGICLAVALMAGMTLPVSGETWSTRGFEAFRRGTFGNAGHNLYVSKKGVLQRIFQYDLDHNGWFDLVFANCQDHHESAPSYVYDVKTGKRVATLAAQGARSGTVADVNGDGRPDVLVAGFFDMVTPFAPTEIYYGQSGGVWDERHHVRIQSPHAVDIAVGRFNGGAKPSVAVALQNHKIIRVCDQTDIGFEWRSFTDHEIEADVLAAADFDGDGFDDLVYRLSTESSSTVVWGGAKGLDFEHPLRLPAEPASECLSPAEAEGVQSDLERKYVAPRLVQAVRYKGRTCFTLLTGKKLILFSVSRDRRVTRELEIPALMGLAVATGDFNADGFEDIAIASQVADPSDKMKQTSWIWLGSKDGFNAENRITLNTRSACHVSALDNLVLFGQCASDGRYTNDALLYAFEGGRLNPDPKRFEGEDTRRAQLFRDADGRVMACLVNHYARRCVGYDRTYVYWGREGGKYDRNDRTDLPSWNAVDAVTADLDDDGWAELIACNNSENSLDKDHGHDIHHFGPNGFEPARSTRIVTDVGWGVAVADFNRDGYLDIIGPTDHWNTLSLWEGGPDGFRRVKDYAVFPDSGHEIASAKYFNGQGILDTNKKLKREKAGALRWPIAVDVNNDGWLDIVSPAGLRGHIFWGGPDGFALERRQEVASYLACGVRAADLDGNGYPELIFGGHCSQPKGNDFYRQPHHSFLHIYWNGPEGVDDSRKCILRADAASHLCVADFDGNGWLDIFSCSYQGDVDRDINSFIYWNRGGNFSNVDRQDLFTHAASGCLAADFNEDGRIDLAVANHKIFGDHTGDSDVWWNTSEGFLPTRTTKLPTRGPHGMSAIEPGNILTRGPEEHYVSEPFVAPRDLTVSAAEVEAEVPPKCWVKVELRVNGGAWREAKGLTAKKGDRLEYRLTLGARNSLRTPRVTSVSIRY